MREGERGCMSNILLISVERYTRGVFMMSHPVGLGLHSISSFELSVGGVFWNIDNYCKGYYFYVSHY